MTLLGDYPWLIEMGTNCGAVFGQCQRCEPKNFFMIRVGGF